MMTWDIARNSIDTYLKLLKQNYRKTVSIRFFGGEPLLNWKLIAKALNYLEHRIHSGLKTEYIINTNGTLLNSSIVEILKKHAVHISVSLDGVNEHHNTYRKYKNGEGSFKAIDRNINTLIENRSRFSIAVVLSDQNYFHLKELIDYVAAKNKIAKKPIGIGLTTICKSIKCSCDTLPVVRKIDLLGKALDYAEKIGVPIEHGTSHFSLLRLLNGYYHGGYCSGAGSEISIDPDGNVYPCGGSEHKLGNIYDLKNVFRNEEYQKIAKRRCGNIDKCAGCSIEAYCIGGCYLENIENRGNYNEDCNFRRVIFETLVRKHFLS